MGWIVEQRHEFGARFSAAFSRENIAQTRATLESLDSNVDHLDMLDRLGLLSFLQPGQLPRYREKLGIPAVNQAVITQVMHFCLQHRPEPMPLHVSVIDGAVEQVQVTAAHGQVYLVIVRTGYEVP